MLFTSLKVALRITRKPPHSRDPLNAERVLSPKLNQDSPPACGLVLRRGLPGPEASRLYECAPGSHTFEPRDDGLQGPLSGAGASRIGPVGGGPPSPAWCLRQKLYGPRSPHPPRQRSPWGTRGCQPEGL